MRHEGRCQSEGVVQSREPRQCLFEGPRAAALCITGVLWIRLFTKPVVVALLKLSFQSFKKIEKDRKVS